MLSTYTQAEMLALWRRRCFLTNPGIVSADNDAAIEAQLLDAIRRWYARLLLSERASLLPRENLVKEAKVEYLSTNCALVTPPERGVRLLSLRMSGWNAPALSYWLPGSTMHRLQSCFATQATTDAPVVVHTDSGYLVFGLSVPDTPVVTPPDRPAPDPAATGGDTGADSANEGIVSPPLAGTSVLTELWMVAAPADGSYILDDSLIPDRP